MLTVNCHSSVTEWEKEQISKYPEIEFYIDKLKRLITGNPEKGIPYHYLSKSGKKVNYKKRHIPVDLFSSQYAVGYKYVSASYVYNSNYIYIFYISYS